MEIEISQIIRTIRRRWWMALVATVLFGTLAVGFAARLSEDYTAETLLLVVTRDDLIGNTATVIELAGSERVIAPVLEQHGMDIDVESFVSENLQVSNTAGTSIVRIEVTYPNPEVAAEVANGIADGVTTHTMDIGLGVLQRDLDTLIYERDQISQQMATVNAQIDSLNSDSSNPDSEDRARLAQLQDQRMRLQQRFADLESKIRTAQSNIAAYSNPVIISNEAVPPAKTEGISPVLMGMVGAMLGALIGAALMIWLELRDSSVRDDEHLRSLVPAISFMRVPKEQISAPEGQSLSLSASRIAGLMRASNVEKVAFVSPRSTGTSDAYAESLKQSAPLAGREIVMVPGILDKDFGTADLLEDTTVVLIVEKEKTGSQDVLEAVDVLRDLGVVSFGAVLLE